MEDEMPCGFGEEPFIFPPDIEIQSLKQQCKCQEKNCCCQATLCCKSQSKKQEIRQLAPQQPQMKTKNCFKCKIVSGSIMYKGQSMCKACSLRNVQYKCRVNLQNKVKITQQDKIIICISGGMNSICLANVLIQLRKKFQKHLLFKSLEAVHVDLSCLNQDQQQYRHKMKRIEEFCQSRQLKLKILDLQELIKQQQLKLLLNHFNQGANQSDIVDIFIQKLIISYYTDHLIALGTSGQRTASNILKFIVKGQGGSLGELSWRHEQKILPFRQHLTKELQFYFHMNGLDQYLLEPPSIFSTALPQTNIINNALEDFIDNLQDTYSHTCPTILRTSEKIKYNEKGAICSFCQSFTCSEDKKVCLRCERLKEFARGDVQDMLPKDFIL